MGIVEIITDGGGTYGVGHLRRSASLAWALKTDRGFSVRVRTGSEANDDLLPGVPKDAGKANVVIIDLPYEGDVWLKRAREMGSNILGLDYRGNEVPEVLVAIVDRGVARNCLSRHFGLEYAIIRPDVAALAPAFQGEGVLVAIGGGDQQGIGTAIAEDITAKAEDVTLIEGPLVRPSDREAVGYRKVQNPKDLPQRMAACSWAVTNGGATMMEMMCLGKAVHVVAQTHQEEELARQVLDQGGLLGVGLESLHRPSLEDIRRVGATARSLVDGRGIERIADLVETLL